MGGVRIEQMRNEEDYECDSYENQYRAKDSLPEIDKEVPRGDQISLPPSC
jgi:hypothetical protein